LLRLAALIALFAAAGTGGRSGAQEGDHGLAGGDELVEQLVNAWFARDFEGYLALWDFASPEQRDAEAAAAREAFAADETRLKVVGRARFLPGTSRMATDVQLFTATEPRARVEHWQLLLERRGSRWAFVHKDPGASMDGLVHLPVASEAWRAQGVALRLTDFELLMEDGTLYHTPDAVGPTALVFVGRGRVRFAPRPEAERGQLRQFAGASPLERPVKWAFVRLHPEDFDRWLDSERLVPEPTPERRRAEAVRRWTERSSRSFVVDADLPRSPWWVLPGAGDAVVEFPGKGRQVLTFAVAGDSFEDINLFDRDRGVLICAYSSPNRSPQRSETRAPVDVLRHNLIVRFEPSRRELSAVDTLRVQPLSPVSTLRLRLHDDFKVSSVSSGGGERLFFLRVREQGSFLVSLGRHAGRLDPFSLTVRYAGRHEPGSLEPELVEPGAAPRPTSFVKAGLASPPPIIYSNRTAWYPRPRGEDFATLRAHFDTPRGVLAVTGGELVSARTSEGRTQATYELQQPGKYFSAAVGRLEDLGRRQRGTQLVHGFAHARTGGRTTEKMSTAEEVLAFFAERFGPCPYTIVNLVFAEAALPGGHSPPGLVVLMRRPPLIMGEPLPDDPASFADMPDFYLAHEIAHQWWGQGVAPASYREQWLSEAWSQYAAALWVRHRKGEDAFVEMLERMASWARRHDDEGPIHLGQRLGHLKRDRRIRRALVYNKGAWVLHMVRGLVGDEAFFEGARAFLESHRYGRATTEDLRAALEEASGQDLTPYFERWIYRTGLPTLLWSAQTRKTRDGYETTVRVQPQGLPGPLPLEIGFRTGGERRLRAVTLDPGGGSWALNTLEPVREIQLDEGRRILAAKVKKVRRLPSPTQR
jgi:hypothetical protein